ncbi:MAG TPA: hypothetical protein VMV97_10100 [Sulfuriferula sp.]|nr:hypothetical protein [Sulfuriferula sp.]
MNYDNPAARLLSLIEEGQKKNQSTNCRAVWQELLEVDDNNPLLMSRLGKAMELPELIIKALVEEYPQQGNTWSHWEGQVNAAFMSQNLNATWASFSSLIDQHTVTYLRLASDLLQAKSNTKLIADDELLGTRAELDAVYKEVLGSNLADEVKKYLIRNLRKLILSIDEYKLTGALPLLDAIETTIGHAHLDKEYQHFLRDTALGKRLLDTLGAMANIVTVAIGIPQLSQAIILLSR